MSKGRKVKIIDIERIRNDSQLDETAKKIIEKSGCQGIITKIIQEEGDKDLLFVSFYYNSERVTQGFRENEIEEVK